MSPRQLWYNRRVVPGESLFLRENVPIAPLTTLRLGGPARFLAAVRTEAELVQAVGFARSRALPLFILGGGSNLLVRDAGFPGLLIQIAIDGPTETTEIDAAARQLRVPAGRPWEHFVDEACEQGLSGVECLAGIPGLTGGTPVQNVGAYGQEVAQTIHSVRAFDLQTDRFVELLREKCQFSYRHSLFNAVDPGRYIVTAVSFRFDLHARPRLSYADLVRHFGTDATPSPKEVADAVREIRRKKGMVLVAGDPDCRSAGSFFKNPVVPRSVLDRVAGAVSLPMDAVPHWPADGDRVKLSAAWLLERAGFGKGYALGPVGISSRHSLALITREGARTSDLERLRDLIRSGVRERFAIELEQEPIELGPPLPRAAAVV